MKRFLFAVVAVFGFALAWNALVHLVVLAEVNASVQHLRRADLSDKLWLSLLLTAAVAVIFVGGYRRFVRTGSSAEAVLYGGGFGVLAGLLVDLNQYLVYPVPGRAVALWCVFGLAEFTLEGLLARRILLTGSSSPSPA